MFVHVHLLLEEHEAFAGVRCPSGLEPGAAPPQCAAEDVQARARRESEGGHSRD